MNFDIDGLDKLQDNLKQLANTGVNQLNKSLDRINNNMNGEGKSQVPEKCPYCGASLPANSEASVIKCEYCGAEFDNSSEKTIVDSVFDFVERQQQIGLEEKKRHLEEARIKAEIKLNKRKKRNKFKFFFIIFVIFAILYYYFVVIGGTLPM